MKLKYKTLIFISLLLVSIVIYFVYQYLTTKKQIEILTDNKISFLEILEKANINSALLVNTQAVDYFPIWDKENSSLVYVNIEGSWYSFGLDSAIMNPFAQLRDEQIAIVENIDYTKVATSTQKIFDDIAGKSSKIKRELEKDKVITKNGVEFEILHSGFSSLLIATKTNSRPRLIWNSDMENCFGLELSKDETYVSYLCEMNGPIIMRANIDLSRYDYYDKSEIEKGSEDVMNQTWEEVSNKLK
jgi:hypothetical protein